ncbi:MAG TPA: efflux RND transporter periplasmic adaptor subunit [Pyrinomonadaceae bacterium]
MNRANIFLVGGAVLCGAVLAGCGASPKTLGPGNARAATPDVNAPGKPVAVQVIEVKPSGASGELLIPAAVSIQNSAVVLAQRDGTVAKLNAQEGSRVAKGQVLAELGGDESLRAQLGQTELEVNRLKVQEREYESLIKLNQNELDREKTLAKDGLSSTRDVERAQYRVDAAKLNLEEVRVATQVAQAKVGAAKIEMEKSLVRAPLTGVVTQRYVKLGAGIVKDEKLFEISQMSPLEVKFQLPQSEGRLALGSIVGLSPVDGGGIVAQARVRRTDSVADPASNTLGYWADVIRGRAVTPGMAVNVHVPRTTSGQTVWIPRLAFPAEAELRSGSSGTVFVVDGGRTASRAVWVNAVVGEQVEVVSGLTPGDRVILAPPAGLKDGEAVEAKN